MSWWSKLTGKVTRREFESLERKVTKHMATVATEIAKANERITTLEAISTAQSASIAGVVDDVAYLKEQLGTIGTGDLNSEQQAAFDAMNARLDAMVAKQQTDAAALKALDDSTTRTTEPPPEPAPTEPPVA